MNYLFVVAIIFTLKQIFKNKKNIIKNRHLLQTFASFGEEMQWLIKIILRNATFKRRFAGKNE